MSSETLTIALPDDAHVHLRDGDCLATTVPASARCFGRAIVMPNLVPPMTSVPAVLEYRDRIMAARPTGNDFQPLMTLYLTDNTSSEEIQRAADSEFVFGCKLYPAGATTNSDSGVTDLTKLSPALERMQATGLPLLVHGEVTRHEVDVFDRERTFLDEQLVPLVEKYPELPVVFEHITTQEAAQFVQGTRPGVAATITPQHLLMNRNDLLVGGVHPHHFCLPVLKRARHQVALQAAATSGSPRFFLGTDSAPHARSAKESACGCAGCYSAPFALELYAQLFDDLGHLDALEGFASQHAADFYGIERNKEKVTLQRRPHRVPDSLDYLPGEPIVPYFAGRELNWALAARA